MSARILFVLTLVCAPACLWRSYADIMRVHLDVLSELSEKAAENARAGQRPTGSDVTELTYPLQRARQFCYQYRSYAGRQSYSLFTVALDRYQTWADAVDAARGDPTRWAAERAQLATQYESWRAAADAVRAALASEA